MRPTLDAFGLSLVKNSPGEYEAHRDRPDAITNKTLVASLTLRDGGKTPVSALTEVEKRYRGKGIANALYDAVEDDIGMPLLPSDSLTLDGFRLWQNRDPDAVRHSLYHIEDRLIGKTVQDDSGRNYEIKAVRHANVAASRGSITEIFSLDDLKDRDLLPKRGDELKRWNEGNRVCSPDGTAIKVFHGSSERFDHFHDAPVYFTPSRSYGYIQNSEVVYPAYISIKKPYFVSNQSDIERLRNFPERIESLRLEGYDGVIYSDPEDVTRGATGWGNDHPQYLVFSGRQVVSALHGPDVLEPLLKVDRPAAPEIQSGLVGYHWSGAYFDEFGATKDIGFHFGTLQAALDRKNATGSGGDPVIDVDVVMPSQRDYLCAEILNGAEAQGLDEQAFNLLMRKLEWPRLDLMSTLSAMSDDELKQVIDEHEAMEDHPEFLERAIRGQEGDYWVVRVDDEEVARRADRKAAFEEAGRVKASFMKKARLHISNPLRLPDLGTWSSGDIAIHSGLDHVFIDSLMELYDTEEDRYAAVRKELYSRGYDGIVYTNETEDPGSESYIAFFPDQIEILNREPAAPSQKKRQELSL